MKNSHNIIASALLPTYLIFMAFVVGACGSKPPYKIDGTVEGLGTQNIFAIYHDGNSMKEVMTNAVDSRFHLEGRSPQPLVIELYNNRRHRIGCIVAQDGDEIDVTFKAADPQYISVKGNEISEALAAFLTKNAGNLNEAIQRQLQSSPDDALSSILAAYYYDTSIDPAGADSLLTALTPSPAAYAMLQSKMEQTHRLAQGNNDIGVVEFLASSGKMEKISPSKTSNTLYMFNDAYSVADSIIAKADSIARKCNVVYIRTAVDTFGWYRESHRFSNKIKHLWGLGGAANPQLRDFNIPHIPFYVMVDTAGHQISRSTSLK